MNFKDFKFLAYENIDREVIQFLRDQGHEVISVIENQWFARSDLALLEFANKESLVVLIPLNTSPQTLSKPHLPVFAPQVSHGRR